MIDSASLTCDRVTSVGGDGCLSPFSTRVISSQLPSSEMDIYGFSPHSEVFDLHELAELLDWGDEEFSITGLETRTANQDLTDLTRRRNISGVGSRRRPLPLGIDVFESATHFKIIADVPGSSSRVVSSCA